ncbi:hypothetical protein EYF80_046943 [Liparis tanakae]|uniref:Uncharacterized protein n=1 Tax=Liparis tanakae TaxID=230148 RepID=A0A4Z2FR67_9TELE|nr:hypothetical protein EYF80_046943 [Liparis tanakae]
MCLDSIRGLTSAGGRAAAGDAAGRLLWAGAGGAGGAGEETEVRAAVFSSARDDCAVYLEEEELHLRRSPFLPLKRPITARAARETVQ